MPESAPLRLVGLGEDVTPPSARLDLVALLLGQQRSPATRRAYELDLQAFFAADPDVDKFLSGSRGEIVERVLIYKQALLDRKLAPATVNRHLASIGALLRLAFSVDRCITDGRDLVKRQRVTAFRDVRGVNLSTMRQLLEAASGDDVQGLRDRAIFALAFETGLRNAEMRALDVGDLDAAAGTLRVVGKGSGGQPIWIDLPPALVVDLAAYLRLAGHSAGPLFRSLAHQVAGQDMRLTDSGLRWIVKTVGQRVGVPLTVHKLRHSSITAARGVTGSMFESSDFARHSDPRTTSLYDDEKGSAQGRVSRSVSDRLRSDE